ncbi:MAG: preprotein translocase subunit SecE [Mariprofundaceae bacterium]|nr:preprotein translocase subunit SecE [Mariprofundaceae bacterium]
MSHITSTMSFIKEVQIQARKVTWPSLKETVQTTVMVIAMVTVLSLFLWGADSVLSWLVKQVI